VAEAVPQFLHETIEGANGPCKVYSGTVAAVSTFNGIPVIVMAASRSALVDVIKEISPNTRVDPSLFLPASLIHDRYIKRKDEEL
jgi:hypothetical protein